jgi:hypothetical protein
MNEYPKLKYDGWFPCFSNHTTYSFAKTNAQIHLSSKPSPKVAKNLLETTRSGLLDSTSKPVDSPSHTTIKTSYKPVVTTATSTLEPFKLFVGLD